MKVLGLWIVKEVKEGNIDNKVHREDDLPLKGILIYGTRKYKTDVIVDRLCYGTYIIQDLFTETLLVYLQVT